MKVDEYCNLLKVVLQNKAKMIGTDIESFGIRAMITLDSARVGWSLMGPSGMKTHEGRAVSLIENSPAALKGLLGQAASFPHCEETETLERLLKTQMKSFVMPTSALETIINTC